MMNPDDDSVESSSAAANDFLHTVVHAFNPVKKWGSQFDALKRNGYMEIQQYKKWSLYNNLFEVVV